MTKATAITDDTVIIRVQGRAALDEMRGEQGS